MKFNKIFSVTALTAVVLGVPSVFAATLFDSQGFEATDYALGPLTGQNGWVRDGNGVATVQSAVVQNGSQAVSLTGNVSEWHWVNLNYTATPGEFVRVTSDIMRGSSVDSVKNFGFFLDAYDASIRRIGRVGLGVSDGNPTLLATYIGDSGSGNYVLESDLSWDTWYSLQVDFKFDTQTFDVYLDGILKASDLLFLVSANNLGDVDLAKAYTSGATDVGYFDDYKVEAFAVPEPTVVSLILLGLVCIAGRSRFGR
jgi:hypothetical protein